VSVYWDNDNGGVSTPIVGDGGAGAEGGAKAATKAKGSDTRPDSKEKAERKVEAGGFLRKILGK
jgi:hypothetical protein